MAGRSYKFGGNRKAERKLVSKDQNRKLNRNEKGLIIATVNTELYNDIMMKSFKSENPLDSFNKSLEELVAYLNSMGIKPANTKTYHKIKEKIKELEMDKPSLFKRIFKIK